MKVKCKFNAVNDIPDIGVRERLFTSIHRDEPNDDLMIGTIYTVIALARWEDGGLWIYLHSVEERNYPYPYPLEMFDVIDSAIPGTWKLGQLSQPGGVEVRIGFAEWIADRAFYEKLVDGDERAIAIYKNQLRNR